MQHQPSHWGPYDLDEHNRHPYSAQSSVHPPTNQQLPAARGPHQVALFPNQQTELDPCFSVHQDIRNLAVWSTSMTAGPVGSEMTLAQPTTDLLPMSKGSPRSSSDRPDHIPADYSFVAALGRPPQEPGNRKSGWAAYSPPGGESPLPAFAGNAPDDAHGFRCRWQGCRSYTSFRRETDLLRHLKTVHISPKAYPCPEPNCDWRFGRKDHLKIHQRNRHGA